MSERPDDASDVNRAWLVIAVLALLILLGMMVYAGEVIR